MTLLGRKVITRVFMISISAIMLTACVGDPIYSIKYTVTFEGKLSDECINAAANAIQDVKISKIEDRNAERDFDEYIVNNSSAGIEVLWFRHDRMKVELSTSGIGYADKERDLNTCNLIRTFKESLIDACHLDRDKTKVNKEYIRSSCKKK